MARTAILESICHEEGLDASTRRLVLLTENRAEYTEHSASGGDEGDIAHRARGLYRVITSHTVRPGRALGLAYAAAYCDVRVALALLAFHQAEWHAMKEDNTALFATARQARELFVPLAQRLGCWQMARRLDDDALRAVDRDTYDKIAARRQSGERKREETKQTLERLLGQVLPPELSRHVEIVSAPYHVSSIDRRSKTEGREISECAARLRFDGIVHGEEAACVQVATCLVQEQVAVLGQDVLRPNGYRAQKLWVYLDSRATPTPGDSQAQKIRLRLVSATQFAKNQRGVLAPSGLPCLFRRKAHGPISAGEVGWADVETPSDFFVLQAPSPGVGVFSRDGELITLGPGASVLDYMCALREELWLYCRNVRVNGEEAAVEERLSNWDVVEISRGEDPVDSDTLGAWMALESQQPTQRRLRRAMKRVVAGQAQQGRYMLRAALQRSATRYGEPTTETCLEFAENRAARLWDDIVGRRTPEARARMYEAVAATSGLATRLAEGALARLHGVVIAAGDDRRGFAGRQVSLCPHCQPGLDAEICGTKTGSGKVMVHRINPEKPCEEPRGAPPRSMIALRWNRDVQYSAVADLELEVLDRPALLSELTGIVSACGLSIRRLQARVFGAGAIISMTVFAMTAQDIDAAIESLKSHKAVDFVRQTRAERIHASLAVRGFTVGVATGPYFIGRTGELARAASALRSEAYWGVVITGNKRIGKTSLLAALCREMQRDPGSVLVVPTLWASSRRLTLAGVLQQMHRAFWQAVPEQDRSGIGLDRQPAVDNPADFKNMLDKLLASPQAYSRLFLTFDETTPLLTWAASGDSEAQAFWGLLGECLATYPPLRLLFTTLPYTGMLVGPQNHVLARCLALSLDCFEPSEAAELLDRGAALCGLRLTSAATNQAAMLAGYHPYFLQIVGMHLDPGDILWGLSPSKTLLNALDIENVAAHFAGEEEVASGHEHRAFFAHMWDELEEDLQSTLRHVAQRLCGPSAAERSRAALVSCAIRSVKVSTLEVQPQALAALATKGVLRWAKDRDEITWSVPLFGLWLTGKLGPWY